MKTVFTKIIERELEALIIWEDADLIIFLPHANFMNKGHLLIVPKVQVDYIFDLEEKLYQKLWSIAKVVAKPLKKMTYAKRIGIGVEGFSVPHVHIHLTPLYAQSELDPHRNVEWSIESRKCFVEELAVHLKVLL
jgi:histidine triad (HIT) family protein